MTEDVAEDGSKLRGTNLPAEDSHVFISVNQFPGSLTISLVRWYPVS